MSQPATRHQPPVTSASDDEVLVRVDGVGKKFCRSLKKSLWYGVCDIGAELNPFRRRVAEVAGSGLRVAGEEEAVTGSDLLVASGNTSAEGASGLVTRHSPLATRHSLPKRRTTQRGTRIYEKESFTRLKMSPLSCAGGN
jgi:hypothetical protein